MASNYSSSTVVQLKELLKSRGLPVNGVKADLISRLEESDKIDAELDQQEEKEQTDVEKKPEDSKPVSSAIPVVSEVPAPPQTVSTTVASGAAKPEEGAAVPAAPAQHEAEPNGKPKEKKIVTLDQLKDEAVEMLTKKIARAERFSSEDEVKPLKTMLSRIQKFGVSPESAIAHELGYKSEAQRKKEEAERKTKEYLQKKQSQHNHGRREHRRRFRPYARERTRS